MYTYTCTDVYTYTNIYKCIHVQPYFYRYTYTNMTCTYTYIPTFRHAPRIRQMYTQ